MLQRVIFGFDVEFSSVVDLAVTTQAEVMDDSIQVIFNVIHAVDLTARNTDVGELRQIIHCHDRLSSNLLLIGFDHVCSIQISVDIWTVKVITLRIILVVDSIVLLSPCCLQSVLCDVIIISIISTLCRWRSIALSYEKLVDCLQRQILGVFDRIQHRKKFFIDVEDILIRIQILINNIIGRRITTSNQVSDDCRDNKVLKVSQAIGFAITRHDKLVIRVAINFNIPLILNVTNCFLSNVCSILPQGVTSVAETIASGSEDVQNVVS